MAWATKQTQGLQTAFRKVITLHWVKTEEEEEEEGDVCVKPASHAIASSPARVSAHGASQGLRTRCDRVLRPWLVRMCYSCVHSHHPVVSSLPANNWTFVRPRIQLSAWRQHCGIPMMLPVQHVMAWRPLHFIGCCGASAVLLKWLRHLVLLLTVSVLKLAREKWELSALCGRESCSGLPVTEQWPPDTWGQALFTRPTLLHRLTSKCSNSLLKTVSFPGNCTWKISQSYLNRVLSAQTSQTAWKWRQVCWHN